MTKPRAEQTAANLLTISAVQVYLPLVRKTGAGRKGSPQEPLFPGYLFSHLDLGLEEWLIARSAHGVARVLGSEGRPTPVPDEIVDGVRKRVEGIGGILWPRLRKGDRVVITAGPLSGLDAAFDANLSASGRSLVLISILGRLAPVTVNIGDLRLSEKAS